MITPRSRGIPAGRGGSDLAATVLFALLLAAGSARADGGFFPPDGYLLYEYEQIAFLDWNAAAQLETLIILPAFHGDAREFAWLVPVPSVPEVAPGDRQLFVDLIDLTQPLNRHRDRIWSCEPVTTPDYLDDAVPLNVEVISRDLIGLYDVTVLRADVAGALVDTLMAWGYLDEDDLVATEPILADYVERAWVFVAMMVDSTAFAAAYPHSAGYVHGGLEPIELRFPAAAPVYPLRLSVLSADWRTAVAVFACADHRRDLAGFTTEYANRVNHSEHAALVRIYPAVALRVAPGRFLTKLTCIMTPEEMSADLPLTQAPDDVEFRRLQYSGFPIFTVFLAGSTLAWIAWRARRRRGRRG